MTHEEAPTPDIDTLVARAAKQGASDLLLTPRQPPLVRRDGSWQPLGGEEVGDGGPPSLAASLPPDAVLSLIQVVTGRAGQATGEELPLDLDFAIEAGEDTRLRVNIFQHRGSPAMVLRLVPHALPSFEALGLPGVLKELARRTRGLILVTGATGHGKSTTVAKLIDYINQSQPRHIVTLEDPIEYTHENQRGIVHQRQIGLDTPDYATGLRAALRQSPDVLLIGELRDPEAISAAITAVETGHLVLGTLHTSGAPETIDRIIDAYPPGQQGQIRAQISDSLTAVLSQALLPRIGGGRVLAYELLVNTPAIANSIRENRPSQIRNALLSGRDHGMRPLEASLAELYQGRQITRDLASTVARNSEMFASLASAPAGAQR